jgi:hypothetical protein
MGSGRIDPYFLDLGTSWEWSATRPGRFTPGERAPSIHCIEGWVDDMNKILAPPGLELLFLRPPGRSQSLYGLRSPYSPEDISPHLDETVALLNLEVYYIIYNLHERGMCSIRTHINKNNL